ncbi:MAG: Hsp20 family protein [Geminicoccaceae bacterium]
MSIVRFRSFRSPAAAVRELDGRTGPSFASRSAGGSGIRSAASPECDIETSGNDRLTIRLAVPGYERESLDIQVQDGRLVVNGDNGSRNPEGTHVVRRNIACGPFERVFALGKHVEIASADLDHGILTIELERRIPEALKPRSIAIGEAVAAA